MLLNSREYNVLHGQYPILEPAILEQEKEKKKKKGSHIKQRELLCRDQQDVYSNVRLRCVDECVLCLVTDGDGYRNHKETTT